MLDNMFSLHVQLLKHFYLSVAIRAYSHIQNRDAKKPGRPEITGKSPASTGTFNVPGSAKLLSYTDFLKAGPSD